MPDTPATQRANISPYLSNYALSLSIDGKLIPSQNIDSLIVRESIFDLLPRISLTFRDNGMFTQANTLCPGMEIKVITSLNKDDKYVIDTTFDVIDFEWAPIGMTNKDTTIIMVNGVHKASAYLYGNKSRCFKETTFSSTVKQIASIVNSKSNITVDSKDSMNWYMFNESPSSYLTNNISRCFVGKDDVAFTYVDRVGALNFSTLRNAIAKKTTVKYYKDPTKALGTDTTNKDEKYFSSFSFKNIAGYANGVMGANGIKYSYYDAESFYVDTKSTYKKTNLVDYQNRTSNNTESSKNIMLGLECSSTYDKYYETIVQNEFLCNNMFSAPMTINIQPEESFKLLDPIDLQLVGPADDKAVMLAYSGKYIIGGIVHQLSKKGTYSMMLVVYRDGINANNAYDKFINPLRKA